MSSATASNIWSACRARRRASTISSIIVTTADTDPRGRCRRCRHGRRTAHRRGDRERPGSRARHRVHAGW
jgi:hypothetical protein